MKKFYILLALLLLLSGCGKETGKTQTSQLPDGIYYVVTDRYSADYSYNNMTVIDTYSQNIFARDLVAEYIAAGGLT